MTKRVAGRSRLRSPTGPSKSAAARRWWKRGTTAVLTAGALAGAISAVLALRPTPDPEDSADITAVRVIPQVTMSEYVQRLEASGQGHFGRAFAARQSTSTELTGESSSPAQSRSSSPRSKSSRSSSAGPTSAETSTAPPTTSPAAKMKANGGFDVVPGTHPDEVLNYIAERDRLSARQFAEYQAILPAVINGASLDDKGQPVDPEVAAQHVLAVLDDARVAGDGTEPVGALVSVDVTLAGLRGKPVALRWSMWKSGGGGQLHGDWLNDNLAYRLEATTARDTTTVDLWVPMPRQEGPYLIRAQLATGSSPLAGKDSEPFS
ncbi:hypothetical protein FPZ12_010700 [Amycolatopsis acidicola]|uniref:Uncharacterized protein n=1 Tax=Amycolatopsis acidicola TaxID=2596893 RepID=A0A5N0V989_9PSEU|nr:hypothetical protein [Amycolatopsis acidicola]KAA9162969.1 hypothetical protein FPZ12_010700 [Amycolatopsis acidicola]